MNVVPQNQVTRPSRPESTTERLLRSVSDRRIASALSPFDENDPVSGMLSEADVMLGAVLDILEDRGDAASSDSPIAGAFSLLVALQRRLRCVADLHAAEVLEASACVDDAPPASSSRLVACAER